MLWKDLEEAFHLVVLPTWLFLGFICVYKNNDSKKKRFKVVSLFICGWNTHNDQMIPILILNKNQEWKISFAVILCCQLNVMFDVLISMTSASTRLSKHSRKKESFF